MIAADLPLGDPLFWRGASCARAAAAATGERLIGFGLGTTRPTEIDRQLQEQDTDNR